MQFSCSSTTTEYSKETSSFTIVWSISLRSFCCCFVLIFINYFIGCLCNFCFICSSGGIRVVRNRCLCHVIRCCIWIGSFSGGWSGWICWLNGSIYLHYISGCLIYCSCVFWLLCLHINYLPIGSSNGLSC